MNYDRNIDIRSKRNLLCHMSNYDRKDLYVYTDNRNLRSSSKVKFRYNFSNLTKLHKSPPYRG